MELLSATRALATLGHEGRLSVFRLLIRLAPIGARPTEMALTLGLKLNTLSHYLGDLEAAGLIAAKRQGRSLTYSVQMGPVNDVLGYLVNDCCRGRPDLCAPFPAASQTRPRTVLFICSGNSARSIMAEALLRDLGGTRFHAFSAGTRPAGRPNPLALQVLAQNGHPLGDLHAKPLSRFQTETAPRMDFVFTVCDAAAAEDCPPWPGLPVTAHWGLPDPVSAPGTDAEKARAFADTYENLRRRIAAFTALPTDTLTRTALQRRADALALA